jgi:death-on-curing protein
MRIYPAIEDVISIHATVIACFGGLGGIRDRGALESAIARPRSGSYDDLIQEAAALWEGLSQNHPFVDGNKRVAVTVAAAFLKVNRRRLTFEDDETYRFLIGLYRGGRMQFAVLDRWMRQQVAQ